MEEEVKEYQPLNFQRTATEAPYDERAYEVTPSDQFSEFYTNIQHDKGDQNSEITAVPAQDEPIQGDVFANAASEVEAVQLHT